MDIYEDAMNRLAKWRSVLAGWQLGARGVNDPEAQAVRDHREATLLLRVDVTAIVRVLTEKGIITEEDFSRLCAEEAEYLSLVHERRFPGMKATATGIIMTMPEAAETMRNWRP